MKFCFFIITRLAVAVFTISFCTLPVLADESKRRSPAALPAPPDDLNHFPEPIKKYAQMIADLCKTSDLSSQTPQLQTAIDGLRKNLPLYFDKFDHARSIYNNLIDEMHIGGFWEWLNTKYRVDVADAFIVTRILLFPPKWPDEWAGSEYFSHKWEHQIYDGLYCYSHGHRPPKTSLAKKPDAS